MRLNAHEQIKVLHAEFFLDLHRLQLHFSDKVDRDVGVLEEVDQLVLGKSYHRIVVTAIFLLLLVFFLQIISDHAPLDELAAYRPVLSLQQMRFLHVQKLVLKMEQRNPLTVNIRDLHPLNLPGKLKLINPQLV